MNTKNFILSAAVLALTGYSTLTYAGQTSHFEGWDMRGVAEELARHPDFDKFYQQARKDLKSGALDNRPLAHQDAGEEILFHENAASGSILTEQGENTEKPDANVNKKPCVEMFMSFTCTYCWNAWTKLRADDSALLNKHKDIDFNVCFLPRSENEAVHALIYEYLKTKDTALAYSYLDFLAENRFMISTTEFTQHKTNEWLLKHGLKGQAELSIEFLKPEIQKAVVTNVKNFDKYGGSRTPSIYVDGKPEQKFFDE